MKDVDYSGFLSVIIGCIIGSAISINLELDAINEKLSRIEKQSEPKDDSVTLEKETGE